MLVSEAIGAALAGLGADTVFGVVGSGNFHVTNALVAHGARFVAARHENGAACMADGWARLAGRPGILSVHQGPGLTNAITGITEAAKSRTPMLVLAADVAAAAVRSNFRIDVASDLQDAQPPDPPPPLFRRGEDRSSASGLLRRAEGAGSAERSDREPDSDFSSLPIEPPALPDCANADDEARAVARREAMAIRRTAALGMSKQSK